MTKQCGPCRECCRGVLDVEILGQSVGKGLACKFLNLDPKIPACGIYRDPHKPKICGEYQCWWLLNEDVPEFLRPDLSNMLITVRMLDHHQYIDVVPTVDSSIPFESLSLILRFASTNKLNIVWKDHAWNPDAKIFWMGSPEFMQAAERDQQHPQYIPIRSVN